MANQIAKTISPGSDGLVDVLAWSARIHERYCCLVIAKLVSVFEVLVDSRHINVDGRIYHHMYSFSLPSFVQLIPSDAIGNGVAFDDCENKVLLVLPCH